MTGLLIVWQIFMMIYIVGLFLMWIIIPVTLAAVLFVSTTATDFGNAGYGTYGGTSSITSAAKSTVTAAAVVSIIGLVFSLVLPIVYIYFWIVVNNLRRELSRPAPQPQQMAAYPQPMYDY